MALVPKTAYPGQTVSSDANYPQGKAQNVIVSGDGIGTPLEKDWVNDIWGFLQALLDRAGITPSGTPDHINASDYQDALDQRFGTTGDFEALGYVIANAIESGARLDASTESSLFGALAFGDSGNKLYLADQTTAFQYSLTTAFDLSTASYDSKSGTLAGDILTNDIYIKDDGLKIFALGRTGDAVTEYALSVAFDISTIGAAGPTLSVVTQDNEPRALYISNDGTKVFMGGTGPPDTIYRYTLPTPWLLTGGGFDSGQTKDISAESVTIGGLDFTPDGKRMFVFDGSTDEVFEYRLTTAFDLTTATYQGISFVFPPELDSVPIGARFSDAGGRMFMLGSTNDTVFEFYSSRVVLSR